MSDTEVFESLVAQFYAPLYNFAFSLTRTEADSWDLTQQTFTIWATKGTQLRDASKVKTWLFTTLYREFLRSRQRQSRFPHTEIEAAEVELPSVPAPPVSQLDAAQLLETLSQLDEIYQAPVALFYLEDYSYNEISEILRLPIGTVKSRLARGIGKLQHHLARDIAAGRNPHPPNL